MTCNNINKNQFILFNNVYNLFQAVKLNSELTRFSSHRVLRQRVLLFWWHNDCQVAAGGMVSRGNAHVKL
ncbi:hypothetical protein Hanom_Chr11g00984291 [Helianthus anomalus]